MNNTSNNEVKYLYSVKDQKYAKVNFENNSLTWVDTKEEASTVEVKYFDNLGRFGSWLYLLIMGLALKKKLIFKREVYFSTVSSVFKTLADLDNMKMGNMK